jgi:hypothetical protein
LARRIEAPLLLMEAPQNATPRGGFVVALYDREFGPQQVDWNVHALSVARLATDTELLFERTQLVRIPDGEYRWPYHEIPELSPADQATHSVNAFWGMLLITAKGVARHPDEPGMPLVVHVVESLRRVRRFIDPGSVTDELAVAGAPIAKLAQLRDLAAQMETLMPEVARRGCPIPEKVAAAADRYLSLMERITTSH